MESVQLAGPVAVIMFLYRVNLAKKANEIYSRFFNYVAKLPALHYGLWSITGQRDSSACSHYQGT